MKLSVASDCQRLVQEMRQNVLLEYERDRYRGCEELENVERARRKKKKRRMERAFNRSIILLPNYRTSYRRNDGNTTFSNRAIVVGQTGETRPVCKSLDSRRSAKGTAGTKGSRAESEKLASRFQRDTRSKRRRMRDAKGGRRVGEKKRKKEK